MGTDIHFKLHHKWISDATIWFIIYGSYYGNNPLEIPGCDCSKTSKNPQIFNSKILLLLLLLLLFAVHTKKGAIKQKLKDESERERLHTRKMSDKKFKG